jgi:hypothetical protein
MCWVVMFYVYLFVVCLGSWLGFVLFGCWVVEECVVEYVLFVLVG